MEMSIILSLAETETILLACATALHHVADPAGIGKDRVAALRAIMQKLGTTPFSEQ